MDAGNGLMAVQGRACTGPGVRGEGAEQYELVAAEQPQRYSLRHGEQSIESR